MACGLNQNINRNAETTFPPKLCSYMHSKESSNDVFMKQGFIPNQRLALPMNMFVDVDVSEAYFIAICVAYSKK